MNKSKIAELFRGFLTVKIKEEEVELFESLIPSFIEVVKQTESEMLQFEAFVNREKREILWMESYVSNKSFDNHMTNPALNDLKQEMMPLQEAILKICFLSSPTKSAIDGFQQYGLSPDVLQPWPGTIRLSETRDEKANIQIILLMELSDVEAYRELSNRIEDSAQVQPGVLFHRSYQLDENHIIVMEEYKDSDAFMAWSQASIELSKEVGSLLKEVTCQVLGNPSEDCRKILNNWGAVYYDKVAGFKHFN